MKNTQEKKSSKFLIILAVVIAALLVIGLTVFNNLNGSGVVLRNKTAAQSENYKVSGTMMSYFIGAGYQQFYQYLGYLGVDTTKSLKSQDCSIRENGGTWFDYFTDMAKDTVNNVLALCEYANENGIKLEAEDKAVIEANIDALEKNAADNNVTPDIYANAVFGNGVKVSDIRKCLELTALADKASAAFQEAQEVSSEEKASYYDEHPEEFNGIDYYTYSIAIASAEDEENDTTDQSADSAVAAVAFAAQLKEASGREDFINQILEYEKALNPDMTDEEVAELNDSLLKVHVLKSNINEEAAEWLFSEDTNVDDVNVILDESTNQYVAYCLAKKEYRDDSSTRSVRHILLSTEDYPEDAEEKAKEVYDELKAAGFSEEKWIELASEYSTDAGSKDNGGLYESIPAGQTVKAFDNWLFDGNRVEGDNEIVESEYGYHVMQYVGENDDAVWEIDAENSVISERFTDMCEEYASSVNYMDSVIDTIVY